MYVYPSDREMCRNAHNDFYVHRVDHMSEVLTMDQTEDQSTHTVNTLR